MLLLLPYISYSIRNARTKIEHDERLEICADGQFLCYNIFDAMVDDILASSWRGMSNICHVSTLRDSSSSMN